ncbi:YcaO-like family protein [Halorussus caseinilyticus]|uniref:YcaO-like family protein n=1 Tax=Halorussus caseinilyticus TaxID=3034025 RepID=A0ABD5WR48_9EURY|nr:YcaO-like family protein [Halorussus sp. DT72]
MRIETPDDIIDRRYHRAIGSKTGLINSVYLSLPNRQDPETYLSIPETAELERLVGTEDRLNLGLSGKGTDLDKTVMSAIGETIERYCLCWPDARDQMVEATYEEIQDRGEVVDWEYLNVFGEEFREQQLDPVSKDTELLWTTGTNLLTGEDVYVPSEYVWIRVQSLDNLPWHFLGSSSGCAAGGSLRSALLGSIYEAVERDAFMRTWCRQSSPEQISLDGYPEVREVKEDLMENEYLDVDLFEFDSDIDIPTVGVAFTNQRDERPKFIMGGSAALDPTTTMIEAMNEAAQGWPYSNYMATEYDVEEIDAEDAVDNFDVNILYYGLPENYDEVSFLMEGEPTAMADRDYPDPTGWSEQEELDYCLDQLEDAGCTPIAFDMTTPDAREVGISVTRVFIPELVFLSPPAALPTEHPEFDGETLTDKPHPYP